MYYKSINTVTSDPAAYLDGLLPEFIRSLILDFVDLRGQVVSNQNLIYIGSICAFINIPLLLVFLTYRQFRERFQALIQQNEFEKGKIAVANHASLC